MLAQRVHDEDNHNTEETRRLYNQLRRDIWDHGGFEPELDRVGRLLTEFVAETIAYAEPVIAQQYRPNNARWWSRKKADGSR
jgi:hypothetical protein